MVHKIGYKRAAPISGDIDSSESTSPVDFLKTIPGILKAVSVLLGFIVVALIAVGYSQASLFNDTENTIFCNWTIDFKSHVYEPDCWNGSYYRDEICQDRNAELSRSFIAKKFPLKSCPSRWLIFPPLYSLGFVWAATCIVLLILLFVQDMSAYRSFTLTDCFGHMFGGIVTIISAFLVIVFFSLVMEEDMCKPENIEREVYETIERNFNRPPIHFNWINYPNKTVLILEREAKCPEIQWETYFHWIFLAAGILGFVLGILYIVIAVMVIMGIRRNPKIEKTAPMQSASDPGQMYDFASPQPQQTPSTHSGSPSQSPDN